MRLTSLFLTLSLFTLACSDSKQALILADGGSEADDGGDTDAALISPCGEVDPNLATADADALFGATAVPTFDFYLPAETWKWLNDHAREEEYVQAQACYNGKSIGIVGLRFKGAYGSLLNCFDAEGNNTCRKLGMKIKTDEYVADQRFFGLKRLNFQGYRWDESYLKERLSYDLYRAMGIVTPRAAWAKLRVNGEEQGLFGMVEQIDGRFVKNRFPTSPDGNLYKEVWPGQTDEASIVAGLETNDKEPNVAAFLAFSQALNAASDTDLRATLGQYVDLDYLARFMAVDDAVANFDGPITWYTNGGSADGAGNHNFFIYEQSPRQYVYIPWDLESTFSLASNYGYVPPWQTRPADCSQTYAVWGGQNRVIAPGCDRVFRALAADLTAYNTAARALLDTYFTVERMRTQIDTWASLIREAAVADAHGPGESKFEDAVGLLKQEVPRLRARLEHIVSGEPTVPAVLSPSQITDFESYDDYSLIAGTGQMSNGNSTTSVAMNTTDPIAGAKTCHFSFDFGNEVKPWMQWAWYRIPMATSPTDFTGWTGVRLKMRANAARTIRLNLESPKHSAADQGIQMGWDLAVTATTKTFEVLFADAEVPKWATDPGDPLAAILQTVTGFMFQPDCQKRGSSGQIADDGRDSGWLDIDDIEFFKE